MTQAFYLNRHEEKNGEIILFNRPDAAKPVWHMRLYVKGMKNANGRKQQYIQRSTGTTDKTEALRIALDEHERLRYRVRHNKPATDITFNALYDLWWNGSKHRALSKKHETSKREGSSKRIEWYQNLSQRYWLAYFGKFLINDIDNGVCRDYWKWREEYWHRATKEERSKTPNHSLNPSKKTLAMEQSALREIFGFAHSEGLMDYNPNITSPYNRDGSSEKRRPSFSKDEWESLDRYMRDRWVVGKGIRDSLIERGSGNTRKAHIGHLWQRQMVRRYIQFIQSTGMRPGEPLQLKHKHIRVIKTNKGNEVLQIEVPRTTKTGERTVHSMKSTIRYYQAIKELTGHTKDDDWVFCDRNGKRSLGYYNTIKSLLKDLNMYVDEYGDARTAYSFRHYYAEQRLDEIGTHPQALDYIAENMGTSWQMLQNFYIRKGRNVDIDTLTGYSQKALDI
jgi:site-specific recombinase XerD